MASWEEAVDEIRADVKSCKLMLQHILDRLSSSSQVQGPVRNSSALHNSNAPLTNSAPGRGSQVRTAEIETNAENTLVDEFAAENVLVDGSCRVCKVEENVESLDENDSNQVGKMENTFEFEAENTVIGESGFISAEQPPDMQVCQNTGDQPSFTCYPIRKMLKLGWVVRNHQSM